MYRTALRSTPSALRAVRPTLASGSRRLVSTAPASKKGTWKGTGLRWGLAAAAVYFYNTSPIFADELPPQAGPAPPHFSDADLPTIDAMIEEKRRQAPPPPPPKPTKTVEAKTEAIAEGAKTTETDAAPAAAAEDAPEPGSPEALEQEAAQQGAFNPETGEINWDCPCLGGMADGPCGEEFKAAFSCFVHSTEETKGIDCVDKFQHMQDCFRKYPEIYGSELTDDEDDEAAPAPEGTETVAKTAEDGADAKPKTEENAAAPSEKGASGILKKATDATEANKVSYAEIASKGPKQSPEEAAAPQPPQVNPTTASSTASLIDVDTPSVHTVPSDFESQEIKTDTQAARLDREEERKEQKQEAAARARAEADLAKKKTRNNNNNNNNKVRKAEGWLAKHFESMSEAGPGGSAMAVANIIAVVGLSGWLGFKAWGLYDRGRFGWKEAGIGLGVLGAVGAVEGVFVNYFSKAKGKEQ
ncbi:mitochondrial intermembrane space import and assembly protein 40 [Chaetomidium leptoderma]|uniref:Mitochondrial intermembrane space import and assembly protein 40 n=1 Tax=Chaetomidium leptoderma TaxID=669021 RepID=A0AAN6ZZ41_9PEZI|nr:mitochondrial intermembrane space import and assembly protein 40 [Chaetomidium leptoderma]